MKTYVKSSDTRFPSLTRAVVRSLGGRDSLEDVCNHGAAGGFAGFTYYKDTLAFFGAHKADIMQLAKDMAADFGQDALQMIAGFQCLKDDKLSCMDVAEAINGDTENTTNVQNALAWFALEEIARELNPDL